MARELDPGDIRPQVVVICIILAIVCIIVFPLINC